jgi:hypothetical protein
LSVTTIALACLEGMRAGLLYMLLTATASATSGLAALRPQAEPSPLWQALLVALGCWLPVAGLAGLGELVAEAAPGLLWIPPLAAPVLLVTLLALWRFGAAGPPARAFTLAPEAALRLALSRRAAAWRLLQLQLLGAVGAGLLLRDARLDAITLSVLWAVGIALGFDGHTPERKLLIALLLAALGAIVAELSGLSSELLIAATAAVAVPVALAVAHFRSGALA